jgi:uncharacterized LabA/DUF88 family protein
MMDSDNFEKVGKRIGNISDLPELLRNQLQAAKTDELERQVLEVLEGFEGVANIDEILVGLYRRFSLIQERAFISNKLYRMQKAGHLISVKGKRGVYQVA